MNKAINSLSASDPSLMPLLDAANAPPALCIAEIMSLDSTANAAATALILPRIFSRSFVSIPNCLRAAIAPSVVSVILSKDGANSVFANAARAC